MYVVKVQMILQAILTEDGHKRRQEHIRGGSHTPSCRCTARIDRNKILIGRRREIMTHHNRTTAFGDPIPDTVEDSGGEELLLKTRRLEVVQGHHHHRYAPTF